jgi:pimeloyl-ACP methyl ester carboxylesterase
MPKLGMTMEEGMVVAWPLDIGTPVKRGDVVLVVENEKSEVEIEATGEGVFSHIYVEPEETVPCGTLLGAIVPADEEGFDAAAFLASWVGGAAAENGEAATAAQAPAASAARHSSKQHPTKRPATATGGRKTPVTPAARKLAKELGIDATELAGTGPGGRVTREDVEAAAAGARDREDMVGVAEGVQLHVPNEGSGDPLLLLPGFGTDVSAFAPQTAVLAESFHVRGVNPRGVGHSDAPTADLYEIDVLAADVAAQIDAPAHIVASSLGTSVAIELALMHPDKVRSLSLLTPLVSVSPRLAAVTRAWIDLAAVGDPSALATALLPWLFSGKTLADDALSARLHRGLQAIVSRVPAKTLERTRSGMLAWSASRKVDLDRIAAPTLVITASDDLLTPDGAEIAAAIPGAELKTIEDAGHAVGIEASDAVNEAIVAHLCKAAG